MKRALLWCIAAGLVATVLSLALLGIRSGPTAPLPTTDPAAILNAAHANLVGNAAPYYRQATAAMTSRMPGDLNLYAATEDLEMRRIAAEWVAQNQDALKLALQGAAEPAYWVDLSSDWSRIDVAARSALRELAKLMAARAAVAIADGDRDTAAKTLVAIDALGRQLERVPTIIDQLIALAIRALAQDLILTPLDNGLQSQEDIAAYSAAVEPCFDPPAGLADALRTEADISAWCFAHGPGWAANFWMHLVAPPSRFNGDLQANLKPLLKLLEQPVEAWADPNHPASQAALAVLTTTPPLWRVASGFAHQLVHSNLSATQLAARFVAQQRGNWTVLQVQVFAAVHGRPPTTLAELPECDWMTDPFSGRRFVYQPEGGEFKVYSLGFDRDDDGGRHDARWGQPPGVAGASGSSDGDYVFWPRQK